MLDLKEKENIIQSKLQEISDLQERVRNFYITMDPSGVENLKKVYAQETEELKKLHRVKMDDQERHLKVTIHELLDENQELIKRKKDQLQHIAEADNRKAEMLDQRDELRANQTRMIKELSDLKVKYHSLSMEKQELENDL